MIILLSTLIVILFILIIIQHLANRARSSQLKQIHIKLHNIISNRTKEKLLVFTDDVELKSILIEINSLLEHNQHMSADFLKMEESMRKMITNISHDLKSPLTVVIGYLEMINLDPTMDEEYRRSLLNKVHAKTNEVLTLIREFFDLARLESGDKQIPLSYVHMNNSCGKNILSYYDTLTAQGFEVFIDIPEKPIFALGNEEALDRVLNNLIVNAIQHGKDGLTVGLELSCDEQFVYVDIWDKGKGIAEQYKENVFERMYTLEDSRNKLYQGSGLGLTITKRLVEAQQGLISLHSKPYEKTVFSIKLKRIFY